MLEVLSRPPKRRQLFRRQTRFISLGMFRLLLASHEYMLLNAPATDCRN